MPYVDGKIIFLTRDAVLASTPQKVCTLNEPQEQYVSVYDVNYFNSGLLFVLIAISFVILRKNWSLVGKITSRVRKHRLVVSFVLIAGALALSLMLGSIADYKKTRFMNETLKQFYVKQETSTMTSEYREYLDSCRWDIDPKSIAPN